MSALRRPAVAGRFYPGEPTVLERTVDDLLAAARPTAPASEPGADGSLKAIVVPHAGYVYSGAVAAHAYAPVAAARERIERVILLGPAHYVPTRIALSSAEAFETPLGEVRLDRAALDLLAGFDDVVVDDAAHAPEHSLEVQLPFLQRVLHHFALVPVVVGQARDEAIAEVVDALWGGPETLVVVSTDLSHYLDHETAASVDRATAAAIVRCDVDAIGATMACGARPLRALLLQATHAGLDVEIIRLCDSTDAGGPDDRVVGYGAFALR
jgi:MEMO1 family protein